MAEDGRPLAIVRGDTTSRFVALEEGIAKDLEDSRRYGRQSLASIIMLGLCAAALAGLVVAGNWPPPEIQIPARANVSAPG